MRKFEENLFIVPKISMYKDEFDPLSAEEGNEKQCFYQINRMFELNFGEWYNSLI